MREVMTIIYFADKTKVLAPDNPNRKADLETWLMIFLLAATLTVS